MMSRMESNAEKDTVLITNYHFNLNKHNIKRKRGRDENEGEDELAQCKKSK